MLYGLQNVFIHHYNPSILMEALGHARYWTDVPGHRALIYHESEARDYTFSIRKDMLESPWQNLAKKSAS